MASCLVFSNFHKAKDRPRQKRENFSQMKNMILLQNKITPMNFKFLGLIAK